MDMKAHMLRQMAFSRGTFGPGERRQGIIEHIRKELIEIEESDGSHEEWVDVVILALDGLWRSLQTYPGGLHDEVADMVVGVIREKQSKNEMRTWPDWRTIPEDRPIEHVRDGE